MKAVFPIRSNANRPSTNRLHLRLLGCLVLAFLSSIDAIEAQTRRSRDVFSQAPRTALRPIETAKEALANESYAEAVTLLGELLVDESGEDYFMPTNRRISTNSIRRTAESLIGEMPQRGLDVYELKYGIAAKKELRRAIEANDNQALKSVARKYLHTDAGYVAAMMLGRRALFDGNFGLASRFFNKIYSSKQARTRLDPEASILYAISLRLSNATDAAVNVIDELKNDYPTIRLNVGGRTEVYTIAEKEETQTWLANVTQNFQDQQPKSPSSLADFDQEWPNYRFDEARSSQGMVGEPLLIPQWTVQLADQKQSELIQRLSKSAKAKKLPFMPTVNAIALKGTVIMRTPEHVFGINLDSGERVWHYPWNSPLNLDAETKQKPDSGFDTDDSNILDDASAKAALRTRLLKDRIYGRISSNGESIYFIEKEISPRRYADQFSQPRLRANRATNRLISLKVLDESGRRVEGQFAWKIDGANSSDKTFGGAFFMGPPLLDSGLAYVLYEVPGQIRLAVLDDRTGELQWSQQIARTDNREEYAVKRLREFNIASPVILNGLLYCPTLTGGLVAIDLADRSLVWGATYNPIEFVYASSDDLWHDNGLVQVGDMLLFSPSDSEDFFAINPESGRIKLRRERDNKIYLAGNYEDRVVIVEYDRITLDNLKGFSARSIPLSGHPTGIGFFAGDFYFLPTSDQRLTIVNLKDAKIENVLKTPFQLGNLISSNGRLISHSAENVAALYQQPFAKTLSNTLLQKNPEDANGLLIKSQLLLADGKVNDAIKAAANSLRALSTPSAQNLITDLLNRKRRSKEDIDWSLLSDLEPLFTVPQYIEKFLITKVESDFRNGQSQLALDSILKLLAIYQGSQVMDHSENNLIEIDSNLRISVTRLLRKRLNSSIQALDESTRKRMIEKLREDFETSLPENDAQKIRTVYSIFADFDFAKELLPRLSGRLIEQGGPTDLVWLEGQLLSLLQETSDKQSRQYLDHLTVLSRLYEKRKNTLGEGKTANSNSFKFSNSVQLTECYKQMLSHPLLNSNNKTEIVSKRSALPEMDSHRFKDGMTGISIFSDLNDPDTYTSGDEQRTRSRRKFHNRLVDEFWTVEVSEDGLFTLRNQFGRAMYSNNSRMRGGLFVDLDYELTDYQLCGSLLILAFGFDHVAIDLSGISGKPSASYTFDTFGDESLIGDSDFDSEDAILWRRTTYVPESEDDRPRTSINRASGVMKFPNHSLVDFKNRRIDLSTEIAADGYCLLYRNRLICLDPWTGDTNWERTDIPNDVDLTGGSHGVYIYRETENKNGNTNRFWSKLNLANGSYEFRNRRRKHSERRFLQSDNMVLTVETDANQKRLLSINLDGPSKSVGENPRPENDSVTLNWEIDLPEKPTACRISDQLFGLLGRDGSFAIYDIESGKAVLTTRFDGIELPSYLYVLQRPEGYLVFVNEAQRFNVDSNPSSISVYGKMYFLDRETGQNKWQSPVTLDSFYYIMNQPYNSPIVLFQKNPSSQKNDQFIAIRLSDGSVIKFTSPIPEPNRTSVVKLSKFRQSLLFNYGSDWLEIKFSDFPRPVEPPVQASSIQPFKTQLIKKKKRTDDPFGNLDPYGENNAELEKWVAEQWDVNPMNPKRKLK